MKSLVIVAALVFCVANGHARSTPFEEIEVPDLSLLVEDFEVKVLSSSMCTHCTAFIGDIRHIFLSNYTQKMVAHSATNMMCSKLTYLKFPCEALIKAYVPLVMDKIGYAVDTTTICHAIKFCTASSAITFDDEPLETFPLQDTLQEMGTKFFEALNATEE